MRCAQVTVSNNQGFYRGVACLSHYPGPECLFASGCLPKSNCTMWGRGTFNWSAPEPLHEHDRSFAFPEKWGEASAAGAPGAYVEGLMGPGDVAGGSGCMHASRHDAQH